MTCQVKHSNSLVGEYHVLTLAEMKSMPYSHVYIQAQCGCFRAVKVNGVSKVWKRSPEKVRIPYKYGLYEYGYITELDEVRVPLVEYQANKYAWDKLGFDMSDKIKGGN